MAKISVGVSFTINWGTKSIEFSKIDARIDDFDLEGDLDAQLAHFDESFDKVSDKLKESLRDRIGKSRK